VAVASAGPHANHYLSTFVSDIAVFVLKRDVKLQPTNQPTNQPTYQLPKKQIVT